MHLNDTVLTRQKWCHAYLWKGSTSEPLQVRIIEHLQDLLRSLVLKIHINGLCVFQKPGIRSYDLTIIGICRQISPGKRNHMFSHNSFPIEHSNPLSTAQANHDNLYLSSSTAIPAAAAAATPAICEQESKSVRFDGLVRSDSWRRARARPGRRRDSLWQGLSTRSPRLRRTVRYGDRVPSPAAPAGRGPAARTVANG